MAIVSSERFEWVYCLLWRLTGEIYVDNIGISVYNLQNPISMYVEVNE